MTTKHINKNYHPESYWSRVAQEMEKRDNGQFIAGDNEPYYEYKRKKFLEMFKSISFANKKVVEIGCGPGGNLIEVLKENPDSLTGLDISSDMIRLANNNLSESNLVIRKIDGTSIPFEKYHFDISFSVTVLQHNTNDEMLKSLLTEMCRVSKEKVILFEKIDSIAKGDELCMARPISFYQNICKQNGFELISFSPINIRVSYFVCGVIRKVFNARTYKEGEKANASVKILQKLSLPITKLLDKIFPSSKDLNKMIFERA